MNRHLQGGCQVPIACYAILGDKPGLESEEIWLRGLVGSPDGTRVLRDDIRGKAVDAETLGIALAEKLLDQGAGEILKKVYGEK
jgi:hydroxymethylbilane synthase